VDSWKNLRLGEHKLCFLENGSSNERKSFVGLYRFFGIHEKKMPHYTRVKSNESRVTGSGSQKKSTYGRSKKYFGQIRFKK